MDAHRLNAGWLVGGTRSSDTFWFYSAESASDSGAKLKISDYASKLTLRKRKTKTKKGYGYLGPMDS